MKVGILALQGSFAEHANLLQSLEIPFVWVKTPEVLESVTHLIMPGGESTTMRLLLKEFEMYSILERRILDNSLAILGTCAGAILCADFLPIEIERNAYGSQQESFEVILESDYFKDLRAVFIRAPRIRKISSGWKVLASFKEEPVMIQYKKVILLTFHPELCGEKRVYEYFLKMKSS